MRLGNTVLRQTSQKGRNATLFRSHPYPHQSDSRTGSELQAIQSGRKERIVTAYILQDLKRDYEDNGDGDYIIV